MTSRSRCTERAPRASLVRRWLAVGGLALALAGCAAGPSEKLTFSTWGSVEEIATLKQVLGDFERAHPAIPVELIHIPDDYFAKLHLLMATNQTPDVVFLNNWSLPEYAVADQFLPLDERLGAEAQAYYPAALDAMRDHGRLLAVPRDLSNLVVYYNADRFKAAGVPLPSADWRYAQFLDAAKRLTSDANGDGKPERFGVSWDRRPLFFLPYVWSFGGDVFDAEGRVTLDAPEAIAGLAAYADLRHREHVAPREEETGNAKMAQLFMQGQIAMFVSGRWSVPAFRKGLGFAWDVAPFPRGPKGSIVDADASGWAIAKRTRRAEDAWTLVKYLSSAAASRRFAASGLVLPARQDVAGEPAYLAGAPAHARVFLDVLGSARPMRTGPRWAEAQLELDEGLDALWAGRQDAASAAQQTARRLREVLGP